LLLLIGQKSFTRYRTRDSWSKYYWKYFLGILGVLADGLNHLVFTMPFYQVKPKKLNCSTTNEDV
jgi:hypothetical protein